MSTAEQIIAEHRWDERRGICECMFVPEFGPGTRYERMTVQAWSAHVVAALTNAGVFIDLPKPTTVELDGSDDGETWTTTSWETAIAYVSTFDADAGDGPLIFLRTKNTPDTPEELRELGAALFAAARKLEET